MSDNKEKMSSVQTRFQLHSQVQENQIGLNIKLLQVYRGMGIFSIHSDSSALKTVG